MSRSHPNGVRQDLIQLRTFIRRKSSSAWNSLSIDFIFCCSEKHDLFLKRYIFCNFFRTFFKNWFNFLVMNIFLENYISFVFVFCTVFGLGPSRRTWLIHTQTTSTFLLLKERETHELDLSGFFFEGDLPGDYMLLRGVVYVYSVAIWWKGCGIGRGVWWSLTECFILEFETYSLSV